MIIKLNNDRSSDITVLLKKLSDQLVVESINQNDLDSLEYWLAWQRSFEKVMSAVGKIVKNVTVTIDAWGLKVEVREGDKRQ